MTVVYEVALRTGGEQGNEIRRWFEARTAKLWRELPQLKSFDVYVPCEEGASDPHVADGAGPCLLCMLSFADEASLRTAIGEPAFRSGLEGRPANVPVSAEAMVRKFYSTGGETREQALAAPFSYVVRYHRPAEDERRFVEHYLADHPALLARLPGIRSVLCYLPIPWQDPNGIASPDYMLGNEVVFDSLEHFNAAMASPVRHELRAHFRKFPAFSGRNTHYPMVRTRLA
ncbi:MAG TPA: EthD family reductase [Xanthobacteraceae bacterium]|jgi:uncharacterized protein (TIGR02118 family)